MIQAEVIMREFLSELSEGRTRVEALVVVADHYEQDTLSIEGVIITEEILHGRLQTDRGVIDTERSIRLFVPE